MKHNTTHTTFKKRISALTAAILAVAPMGNFAANLNASAAHTDLTGLSAFEITAQMKLGWNLGNSLDCDNTGKGVYAAPSQFVTAWGNPEPTAQLFKAVKAAGFNTVRIPTTWYEHLEWDSSTQMYTVNDTWMDYVKQVVDYAYDLDMFVILNAHHENWVNVSQFSSSTYRDAEKKLTSIWSEVAEEFADYDQHLIFEGLNEPRQRGLGGGVEWGTGDSYSRGYVNDLNEVFVNTVRAQGSSQNAERLLMIPGYCARHEADALNAIEIPQNGGNIAVSVHAYEPYYFTMATDGQANHNFPSQSYESNLDSLFSRLENVIKSKNVPVVIGEFGASDFNNTASRAKWAQAYVSRAKEAGIPCVLWDNNKTCDGSGEAHGYFRRGDGSFYPQSKAVVEAMTAVYSGGSVEIPDEPETIDPTQNQDIIQTNPSDFSWSNIPVEYNWISLYYNENGKTMDAWGNDTMQNPNWKAYLNDKYEYILVYASAAAPYLVLQGGWYKVFSDDTRDDSLANMMFFDYDDITRTMEQNGASLSDMYNFFISADSAEMTAYALYAVPAGTQEKIAEAAVESTEPETEVPTEKESAVQDSTEAEEPTETDAPTESETETESETAEVSTEVSTEPETEETNIPADFDGDGAVSVADVVILQQYLLGIGNYKRFDAHVCDVNGDGKVNVLDLVSVKRMLLQTK